MSRIAPSTVARWIALSSLLLTGRLEAQHERFGPQGLLEERARADGGDVDPTGGLGALTFVANRGQWDPAARFIARRGGAVMRLEDDAVAIHLVPPRRLVRLEFEGASAAVELEGTERRPGLHHFLIGSDSSRWRTGVPGFDRVVYRGIYDGVDLQLRDGGGLLEYDLILSPHADLGQVSVRCKGVDRVRIDRDGALVMELGDGRIVQKPPTTWEELPSGERRPVRCHYRILGEGRYGFEVPERDHSCRLVVDPGLDWSTFLGGNGGGDMAHAVAVDATGIVTVGGWTNSTNFPTTPGAYDEDYNGGDADAFLARFDPTRTGSDQLLWCTYLGGSQRDRLFTLTLDGNGSVIANGGTFSDDFPTTPGAYSSTLKGEEDAWVARLDPEEPDPAKQLAWSTLLGGSDREFSMRQGIHVDDAGVVTTAGMTFSVDFPTTPGAYDEDFNGGDRDVFVARLDPAETGMDQLVYGTYLGGDDFERLNALTVDDAGVVTVGGWTSSTNFPTTPGAYDESHNGLTDAYVTRLSPDGNGLSDLTYSTFLGHTGEEGVNGMIVDADGVVTIGGSTSSPSFPTTSGAYDTGWNGPDWDAFVARLSPDQDGDPTNDLIYSTFLGGGTGVDHVHQLAMDANGGVNAVGLTDSSDFPITRCAWDPDLNGGDDVFVCRMELKANGPDDLASSTYLGGRGNEYPWAIALDEYNLPVVVGLTLSSDFPTTPGAYQEDKRFGQDCFLSRITMVSWCNYGDGVAGTLGVPSLTAGGYPVLGRPLDLHLDNSLGAPTAGVLFVGLQEASLPLKCGALLLVPILSIPLAVPGAGLDLNTTVPDDDAFCDLSIYLQAIEQDPGACGDLSFSPGLRLVLGG